jgi:hypothetical protein
VCMPSCRPRQWLRTPFGIVPGRAAGKTYAL